VCVGSKYLIHSFLLPSSFDTSASDRGGLGGGGIADEGQDGARLHFRFMPQAMRSATADIRTAASVEEHSPGPELPATYRAAFGRWGSGIRGEELQPEQHDACDDDVPFEVIGGW
jgi:hypothetical protein